MRLQELRPGCSIDDTHGYVRVDVASRGAADIQECYRSLGAMAITRKVSRVLVVGIAKGDEDPHVHLAARDLVVALHVIGVPKEFKIGFVPAGDATLNGFRHAEIAAIERGLSAKVFKDEREAIGWLTADSPPPSD